MAENSGIEWTRGPVFPERLIGWLGDACGEIRPIDPEYRHANEGKAFNWVILPDPTVERYSHEGAADTLEEAKSAVLETLKGLAP